MRAFLAILAFVIGAKVSAREVVIPSQPVSPYSNGKKKEIGE